jgi:hypothetical protein
VVEIWRAEMGFGRRKINVQCNIGVLSLSFIRTIIGHMAIAGILYCMTLVVVISSKIWDGVSCRV